MSYGFDGYSVQRWVAECLECGGYGEDIAEQDGEFTCLECGSAGESIIFEDVNAEMNAERHFGA